MSNILTTIEQIAFYERQQGRDPVEAVQDYFLDKDCRFTRGEIEAMIDRALGWNPDAAQTEKKAKVTA